QRPALPIANLDFVIIGDAIQRQKTQIVRRELIFNSRIAKPYDQLHACSNPSEKSSSFARGDGRGRPSAHGLQTTSSLSSPASLPSPEPLPRLLPRSPAYPS